MGNKPSYTPKKGDLVWIDFDPSSGKEIQKRRSGLVVSRYEFNYSTKLAVICPITSTIRDYPTNYTLPDHLMVSGQVIVSQLKPLDFHSRKLTFSDKLPFQDVTKIDQIIEYMF